MRKLLAIVGMAMLAFTFACGAENANNGNANRPMNANRPPVNANTPSTVDSNANSSMGGNANASSTGNANMSNANRGNANR